MSRLIIHIAPTLKAKMDILSSEYNCEIAGYLLGDIVDGVIYLKDLLIPEQAVNSVRAEISGEEQVKLRQKYGLKKMQQIIGLWHSHHTMGADFSETDEINMAKTMEYKDLAVFIVSSNKKHAVRVYTNNPFKHFITGCELKFHSVNLSLMKKKVERIFVENDNTKEEDDDEEDDEDD